MHVPLDCVGLQIIEASFFGVSTLVPTPSVATLRTIVRDRRQPSPWPHEVQGTHVNAVLFNDA